MSVVTAAMMFLGGAEATPPPSYDLLTNLIEWWSLDGNANGSLGVANGTPTGVSWVTGKVGQAAQFPIGTTNAAIDLTNTAAIHPTGKMSHSMWLKVGTFVANNRPASDWHQNANTDRWVYYDNGTGVFDLYMLTYPTGNTAGDRASWGPITFGTLTTGTWYHLGFSYDRRYIKTYKNGSLVTTLDTNANASYGLLNAGMSNLALGQELELLPSTHDTTIDCVGIWGRDLAAADFAGLYNSGNGLQYPF